MQITIPLEPVTKKNSQRILINKATGRAFIAPSAKYKAYEKACALYVHKRIVPIDIPVNVKMVFYTKTHRRCDLVNHEESCLDILVKYGILSDDNSNIVVTMDGSQVLYDKDHPRTEITITPKEGKENGNQLD